MKRFLYIFFLFLFVLSTHAQTYEQWVERGIKAAEADSLTEAVTYFKKALKANPKDYRNALVFTNMGKVQETMYWQNTQEKQNASDAIESYTMALGFAPEAVPMLEARGKLYLRLENCKDMNIWRRGQTICGCWRKMLPTIPLNSVWHCSVKTRIK